MVRDGKNDGASDDSVARKPGIFWAVIYSRVSTDAQEKDGSSLVTQERAGIEYAQTVGRRVVKCIRDTASGFTLDRPGIQEVRQMVRAGLVDVVIAYAVDRLSRNQNQVGVLFDKMEQAGVLLEFVTENFEDTAVGRFIRSARAFVAEVEREKISERTTRGKTERARSGRIPQGTGKGIYGYEYIRETGRREVVADQAAIIQQIFEQFCLGAGCSRIAGQLNRGGVQAFGGGQWHPLTVRRILLNETYTGRTVYRRTRTETVRDYRTGKKKRRVLPSPESQWIDIPGATPALISQELFTKAQVILNDPARRLKGQPTYNYKLKGHLRCLACGTPMVGQAHQGGRYRYYRCRRSYSGNFEGKCNSRYVAVDLLENTVREQIVELLADPQRILEEARYLNEQEVDSSRLEATDQEIRQVEGRQRRLARLYVEGSIPEDILSSQSGELNNRRLALEANRRSLLESAPQAVDIQQLKERLPEAAARLGEWVLECSDADMELILKGLSVQVLASHEEIHIEGTAPIMIPEAEKLVTIERTSA